jgi:predicted AlkP superfamily pyrophosphatase or phosphodiesterase
VTRKKLILAIIDGLTPSMLEGALERGDVPTLARLAEHGTYGRASSTFPSLTPVCLSSIATGAHPDVHEIPHLVWYHRGEQRLVEYGSSFGAVRAAGIGRTLRDALVNMNAAHLGTGAVTMFEALDDAGFVTAAVNFTAYRGRTLHRSAFRPLGPVRGPRRFFFYNLFESDETGAPLSWRNRAAGTVDAYAAAVGRWLVTRDGFDFLVFYLSDYDYASHEHGPDAAYDVLRRSDDAVGDVVRASGGVDEFLERYAIVVMSDHGQTTVREIATLQERFAGVDGALVTASNRAGMVYRLDGCRLDARQLAVRLDGDAAVEVALFREGDEAVARREGEELRFAPGPEGWELNGDLALLEGPDALTRAWAALQNPNAGEVLVAAAGGSEFADLGRRHHLGGGSHGSLAAGDSEVPVLAVGVEATVRSIVDVAPLVLAHFGVDAPAYARRLDRAA